MILLQISKMDRMFVGFFFVLFCEFTHKYDLFLCILGFLTSHVLTRSKFYCYLIIFHYQMLFSTCSEVISIILFFICLFASRLIVFFFLFNYSNKLFKQEQIKTIRRSAFFIEGIVKLKKIT